MNTDQTKLTNALKRFNQNVSTRAPLGLGLADIATDVLTSAIRGAKSWKIMALYKPQPSGWLQSRFQSQEQN